MLIIGNKPFFLAVKRAIDLGGGFHVVGMFKPEDLEKSLPRSRNLGQIQAVVVSHENRGNQASADVSANATRSTFPDAALVLVTGGDIDATHARRLGSNQCETAVVSETALHHPRSFVGALDRAISAASGDSSPQASAG